MSLKKFKLVYILILCVAQMQLIAQQLNQANAVNVKPQTNACGITVNAGPDITICAGIGKNLNGVVVNSTDYSWEPPDGLSNPKILKPLATPSMTTTYTLVAKGMSGNLITNGSFENGSIAPATSMYTQYTDMNLWFASTGGYMVMSVPQIAAQFGCNPNIGAFTMAITPTGSSSDIWCQTKPVNPNTDYKITFKLIGIPYIFGSPPDIGLKVNGKLVGSMEPASGFCTETTASFVWNSGASVSANFCLANYGGTGSFAICAIDDITVKECCVEKDEVVVTVYELTIDVTPPDEINCLNKPITIDASASSQGPGISYDWSTKNGHFVSGDKTLRPIVDTPGTYTLKLTGLYGCEKTIDVIVKGSVTKPDIKTTKVDIDCQNPTGSIDASSKSNSPQYEWNGPNGFYSSKAKNINLKEPGEYIVKITDFYGCESTAKVEVKDNRSELEAEITGDSITCSKDSAILRANSIARKPIYRWTGPFLFKKDSSDNAIVKDTGWYYLSTTDSAGCKELDSFYVKDLQNSIPISIQADTIKCSTPDVILKLKADTSASFKWSGPNGFISTKYQPMVSDSGWYYVEVKTKDGCIGIDSIYVEKTVSVPDIKITSIDIDCQNATGSIDAISKSSSPQYEWNGPNGYFSSNAKNINLTEPGEYIIKVTDSNGCESTAKVEIKDNRMDLKAQIVGDSITCYKDSATLKANSIARKPIYRWTGPFTFKKDSSDNAVVRDTGWYYLSTTDSSGCKELDSFYVKNLQNSIPISIQADTIKCSTPDVILKLQADTSAAFQWKGPNGFLSNQYRPQVSESGWYYVEVKTKDGCIGTDSIFVEKEVGIPDIFISSNDTITCDKKSIQVSGGSNSPGALIEWMTPSGLIKNQNMFQATDSGNYLLTVIGINGCKISKSIQIFKDVSTPIIFGYKDTLDCNKDTLNLIVTANNVRAYSWTGPNNFTSNISSPKIFEKGNYIITVTANNGCQSTAIITIEENKSIPNLQIQMDTLNCIRTTITPNVISDSSAISFSWTGPNGFNSQTKFPTILIGGNYTLIIKGKNGCLNTQTISVIEDIQKPSASLDADTIKCKSNAYVRALNISPGASIQWKGPKGFISNLPNTIITESGFYVLTLIAANGCTFKDSVFVFQKDQLPDIFALDDTLRCDRPKLFLNGGSLTPGVQFLWTGPNGFNSNIPRPEIQDSGNYILKVIDANGCESLRQIHIFKNSSPPLLTILKSNDNITCKDSLITIQLTANQIPKNILWLGPNGFQSSQDKLTLNEPGYYLIIFTNEFGCIARDSFTIQDFRSLPNYTVSDDSLNCIRTNVNLQLTNNSSNLKFQWSGPNNFSSTSQNPKIQLGGNYTVIATDTINNCQLTKTIFIKADTIRPDLSISADTLTCQRSNAPVKASSSLQGFTMKWTGPNGFSYTLPQFATKIPGRYFCTITNPRSGCSTTSFVDVLEDTSRIRDVITQIKNSSCNKNNGKILVTQIDGGKQPFRFSIDNGVTFTSNLSNLDLAPGSYTVFVEDTNGCRFTVSLKIDEDKSIDIGLPNLIQLKPGELKQLNLTFFTDPAFISTILWSPSDQLSCDNCPDPILTANHEGLIFVTVIDVNGCVDTARIQLQILKDTKFFFPNTFSPNGDNINDYFFPIGLSQNAKVSFLDIYDRWGNLVFEKKDFQVGIEREGWNGLSIDQKKVNPGVYVFVAEISDQGITYKFYGDVTLIQ